MPVQHLVPSQLRSTCDPNNFDFETTADLPRSNGILGQPRGVRAIEFGISIRSQGYNIYVLGDTSTGRTATIRHFLEDKTRHQPTPDDWVYVHNFRTAHQPRAIEFPAGQGAQFRKQMEELVASLQDDVPKAFSTEEYEDEVERLERRVELKQNLLMRDLERKAQVQGFAIIKTAAGLTATPVVDGNVMTHEQFADLSIAEQQKVDKIQQELEVALEDTLRRVREIKQNARNELLQLDRRVAERAIAHHVNGMSDMYSDHDEVMLYLSEVHEDVLVNLDDFRKLPKKGGKAREVNLRRYDVNMFVDNARTEGAPVIVEQNPSYNHLIGRIEYEMRGGIMSTHFTNIKPGSLHLANGGYLVMDAADLINEPHAWEALRRSIKGGEIVLQPYNTLDGSSVLAKSIDPEAIPLDIKIILMGSPGLYYHLLDLEEDFTELFKVKADFSDTMERDNVHEMAYANYIANRCREDKLPHFDRDAVARVVEFGSEIVGQQKKLSARFGEVGDLVIESSYWANHNQRDIVTRGDVECALKERVYRSNKVEKAIDEDIADGTLLIQTSGAIVGQVNGLSIIDLGDYIFGRPTRITARTYMGGGGVVHIERETDMSDSIHNKGVLTISGYLGGTYAQDFPLSVSASLTFEQNYVGVGGDSASSAELITLLSSIANVPITQSIAVTGSINQRGDIQPIGGATEKIEGFFRVCEKQGLTGKQGVIIPQANIQELMLQPDVIGAVEAGTFHIWSVTHIDECLELLFEMPAGVADEEGMFSADTLHGRVQQRLRKMARKENGDDDEENEEN